MKRLLSFAVFLVALILASSCYSQPATPELELRARTENYQLSVVTSGGFASAYDALAPQFELETGIQLHTSYGSSKGGSPQSIPMRLSRGEVFDVIILSRSSLDELTRKGEVDPRTRTDLVYSAIGMAVRSGAVKPDITSKEAFVKTLLAARSIGYSASASGTYLSTELWPQLGIWNQIKHKSRRILGERVASVVARGEVQIGFQQISEILPIVGAEYVGPIPKDLQKITTFSAAIPVNANNPEGARKLIDYLSSRKVTSDIASKGLVPVILEK